MWETARRSPSGVEYAVRGGKGGVLDLVAEASGDTQVRIISVAIEDGRTVAHIVRATIESPSLAMACLQAQNMGTQIEWEAQFWPEIDGTMHAFISRVTQTNESAASLKHDYQKIGV